MILRGIVSSMEAAGTRVTFPDKENTVSAPLPSAASVGALTVGNNVAVVFFADNMSDGLILAKY